MSRLYSPDLVAAQRRRREEKEVRAKVKFMQAFPPFGSQYHVTQDLLEQTWDDYKWKRLFSRMHLSRSFSVPPSYLPDLPIPPSFSPDLPNMSRSSGPDLSAQHKKSIQLTQLRANTDVADVERVWQKFEGFRSDLQQHWEYAERERLIPLNLPSSKLIFQGPRNSNTLSLPIANYDMQKLLPLIVKKDKQSGTVICLLEDIFERIIDSLLTEKTELVFYLKLRKRSGKGALDATGGAIGDSIDGEDRAIRFPGNTVRETWRFAVLLRILALSHSALVNGAVITKRDIFYQDPDLFLRQDVVNRYVDDIACTLNIKREELNIVAAAKGLIAGHMTIFQKDGKVVDCRVDDKGILTSSMATIDHVDIRGVGWLLVVEKEATFRTLVHSRFWDKNFAGKGILMTGKGYPDNITKAWVRYLSMRCHPCGCSPVLFALMDFDPDGLAILSTYKHGSISTAWQNASLVSPGMEWLGIKSEVIQSLHQDKNEGWLRLTSRDRKMAAGLLEKAVFQDEVESSWRRELQVMLMLNIKAEIQILELVWVLSGQV